MKCRLSSGQRAYSFPISVNKRTKSPEQKISSQLAFHLKKTRERTINLIQTKKKEGNSKLWSRMNRESKKQ